jgi:hypothetical protein
MWIIIKKNIVFFEKKFAKKKTVFNFVSSQITKNKKVFFNCFPLLQLKNSQIVFCNKGI